MLELAGELMGDYDSEESESSDRPMSRRGEAAVDSDEEQRGEDDDEKDDGDGENQARRNRGNGRRGPRNGSGRRGEGRSGSGEGRGRRGLGRIVMSFRNSSRDRSGEDEEVARREEAEREEEREQRRRRELARDDSDDESDHNRDHDDRMVECLAEAVQMARSFKRAYENGNAASGERKRLNDRRSESEAGDATSSSSLKAEGERSFPRAPTAHGEDMDSIDGCNIDDTDHTNDSETEHNSNVVSLSADMGDPMDSAPSETDKNDAPGNKGISQDKMDDDSDTESEHSVAASSSSSGLSDDGIFDQLTFRKSKKVSQSSAPRVPPEPNYLRMKVEALPLPQSLISYILYYREI